MIVEESVRSFVSVRLVPYLPLLPVGLTPKLSKWAKQSRLPTLVCIPAFGDYSLSASCSLCVAATGSVLSRYRTRPDTTMNFLPRRCMLNQWLSCLAYWPNVLNTVPWKFVPLVDQDHIRIDCPSNRSPLARAQPTPAQEGSGNSGAHKQQCQRTGFGAPCTGLVGWEKASTGAITALDTVRPRGRYSRINSLLYSAGLNAEVKGNPLSPPLVLS